MSEVPLQLASGQSIDPAVCRQYMYRRDRVVRIRWRKVGPIRPENPLVQGHLTHKKQRTLRTLH